MKIIRIGNDIRLNVSLAGSNIDIVNIKHLRCYIVNQTQKEVEMHDCDWVCHSNSCIHRFPIEPKDCCHCPDKYMLHCCGKPTYYAHPANCYRAGYTCDPAFGPALMPNHKCCCCPHRGLCHHHEHCCPCRKPWSPFCRGHHPHFDRYEHLDGHFMCDCFDHVGRCNDCCGDDYHDLDFKFIAPAEMSAEKNHIQCYFPACDQYLCGAYKLVIVITVYEPGWGCRNLHTYTFDYGNVFTLVDDEVGLIGDITINIPEYELDDDTPVVTPTSGMNQGFVFYSIIDGTTSTRPNLIDGAVNNVIGTHVVSNTIDGAYLWVACKSPISSIRGGIGEIPYRNLGKSGSYYYYCGYNAQRAPITETIEIS